MPTNNQTGFRMDDLPIADLLLDPHNARLPEEMQSADQDKLLKFIAEQYDAIWIARSIASHGYFPSEPLIVVPTERKFIVVEGNRRLAAVKLLRDEGLQAELDLDDADDWDELAESSQIPDTVPVVVVDDRRSVAPIIGYRHISGIEPWDPWAKARFIATLLDDEGLDFDEAAHEVGEDSNDIRDNYRNYIIVQRARQFGIPTDRVETKFGVFTRAMNSPKLREHIGTPVASGVKKNGDIVPDDRKYELAELLSWLFGTDSQDAVIGESRDITKLGTAVGSDDGLAVLRETRDLNEADIAAGGLRHRLLRRINTAIGNLRAAEDEVPAYSQDEEVITLLERCRRIAERLLGLTRREMAEADVELED